MTPDAKIATLLDRLAALPSLAVAFSGGADSALVLAAAVRAAGTGRVLAVTAVSDSLAAEELDVARRFAVSLGVRHLLPRTDEAANPGYRANGRDRCYFCKSEVLDVIGRVAAEHGFAHVATGTNADDAVDPFRPGIRAADERGGARPAAGRRPDQGRGTAGQQGVGPGHLGQAGRALPGQPGGLRP
ncbi:asparagine synthase-related protein [Streptosporangium vulgare]|uniref:asparagine synthase-related protein n=1 Tax=Streptosporangium vulgare TaxID=46190 RepID=UPI0031DC9210